MDQKNFYAVFYIITLFLLFFYSAFLLTARKKGAVSHYLLAFFLSTFALSYVNNVVMTFKDFFFLHCPFAIYFGISFELLTGPALYFYVRSITEPGFKLRKSAILHAIPFCAHFLFFTSRYHMYSPDIQRSLLRSDAVFTHNEKMVLLFVNHIHFLVYTVVTIILISRYHARLRQLHSSLKGINLTWAMLVTGGLIINWSCHFLNSYLWTTRPDLFVLQIMDYRPILVGSAFLFACIIVYKNLQEPELAFDLAIINSTNITPSDVERQRIWTKINRHMEENRPYLEPSFDLKMLAQQVSEKAYLVSRVLNQHRRQNFYDFVNSYRVQETKRLLASPQHLHKNITEIMYECGFNTKSVFNTAFKKLTGLTPKQFRKSAGVSVHQSS